MTWPCLFASWTLEPAHLLQMKTLVYPALWRIHSTSAASSRRKTCVSVIIACSHSADVWWFVTESTHMLIPPNLLKFVIYLLLLFTPSTLMWGVLVTVGHYFINVSNLWVSLLFLLFLLFCLIITRSTNVFHKGQQSKVKWWSLEQM